MRMSENIGDLVAAIAKARKTFGAIKKGRTAKIEKQGGGGFAYKYANLEDVLDATEDSLIENGLQVFQSVTSPSPATVAVSTMIAHTSGQWMESDPVILPASGKPQDTGIGVSYLRRYSQSAMLNLVQEDNDGQVQPPGARKVMLPEETEPSIDQGKPAPKADAKQAAPTKPAATAPATSSSNADDERIISAPQAKRLYAIMKEHDVPVDRMKAFLALSGIASGKDIKRKDYDNLIAWVQAGGNMPKEQP